MTTQKKKPSSLFPDIPRGQRLVDKEGNITPSWNFALNDIFQGLQKNFSNEGVLFPILSASDIADIQANYTSLIGSPLPQNIPDISGKTVFDKDNRVSKQFVIAYDNTGKIILATWVNFSMILFGSGNPNGSMAGVLGWLCYDMVNKVLYACTAQGSAGTAVWTSI